MFNFDWLANLPVSIAKLLVLMAFVIPLFFTFTLPKKYIYLGACNSKLWRNLKYWVLLLVIIQMSIYIYF